MTLAPHAGHDRFAAGPALSLAAAPVVELLGATKRYGTVEALRGIDLVIQPGEITAILGPNGAGKTTALSLILGLRRPTAGTVRLLGLPPEHPAARARVGAMLQESGVPPMLSVAELVELFSSYYPHPRRAAEVIAAAGLAGLEGRRAGRLSGGQRQRLFFALALCGDPELVVLDEPTTGLDVESRRHFWDVVTELARRGATVLFATHLLEEADALATRIVVINHGQIVRDGTPAQVKAQAGGKTIHVRADLDPAVVAHWPGVIRVERTGSRLEIVAADAEAVLGQLFSGGTHVEEVTVEERALETAFLDLVKENES
jgi:ABC-2 type transport system ATP-binding protein